ncbi:hypothetical protein QTP88_005104 [Uroleucon formosanum]
MCSLASLGLKPIWSAPMNLLSMGQESQLKRGTRLENNDKVCIELWLIALKYLVPHDTATNWLLQSTLGLSTVQPLSVPWTCTKVIIKLFMTKYIPIFS